MPDPSGLASTASFETPVNQSGDTSLLPLKAAILINKVVGLNCKIQLKKGISPTEKAKNGEILWFSVRR